MSKVVPRQSVDKIDSYCASRDFSHSLLEQHSQVYKSIVDLNNEFLTAKSNNRVARKGGLEQKTKVLTLLSLHVADGTEQSVEFSLSACLQVGATEPEILDALDLALLTRGGSAVARAQFAAQVLIHRRAAGDKSDRFEFISRVAQPSP